MTAIPSSRRHFLAGAASATAGLLLPRPARSQPASARQLVPRETFFGDPDVAWAQLSFDGARVAYIAPVDGVRNLWVAPIDDLRAARPVTRVTERPIGFFFQWAYTNRHVVFFEERDGDENWRASSVDIHDGTIVPLTPPRGVRAWVQEVSQRFPREMLFMPQRAREAVPRPLPDRRRDRKVYAPVREPPVRVARHRQLVPATARHPIPQGRQRRGARASAERNLDALHVDRPQRGRCHPAARLQRRWQDPLSLRCARPRQGGAHGCRRARRAARA